MGIVFGIDQLVGGYQSLAEALIVIDASYRNGIVLMDYHHLKE